MWLLILRWVIVNVLIPAIVGSSATLLTLRNMEDTEPIESFAASPGGGNFLLWVIVIGLVVHAFLTSKAPQFEAFKAWVLSKLAGWLSAAAEKIKSGVSQ